MSLALDPITAAAEATTFTVVATGTASVNVNFDTLPGAMHFAAAMLDQPVHDDIDAEVRVVTDAGLVLFLAERTVKA